MARQLLCAAVLLAAVCSTFAHHPIVNGTTQAPWFSTWQTALTIPTNKVSLSVKRLTDCNSPFFWLKFTGKKGDELLVAAGTSAADGLADTRISVAVFGPGIKTKAAIKAPAPNTAGSFILNGPTDISNCKWLPTKEEQESNSVIKGRCGTVSKTTGVGYFPLLSNRWKLPATGTFYFAFYTQSAMATRYYVNTGSYGHSHANVPGLPKVSPNGNAKVDFNDKRAKSTCCNKRSKCSKW